MLNKLSINIRFLMLVILPTLVFVVIGFFAFKGLQENHKSLQVSDQKLNTINLGIDLNNTVNDHYTKLLKDLDKGYISWETGRNKAAEGIQAIITSASAFNDSLISQSISKDSIQKLYEDQDRLVDDFIYLLEFLDATEVTPDNVAALSRYVMALSIYQTNSTYTAADMLRVSVDNISDQEFLSVTNNNAAITALADETSNAILAAIIAGSLLIMLIGFFIAKSINKPTKELTEVVTRLSDGEFDARANIIGTDEIAKLSTAFNGLLDDRAITLSKIDEEHQELNQSVFSLLEAVAELSERDLTIRATVTEDATGPVADALNLLAEETSDTLKKVKRVASDVHNTSSKVNSHLMSINKLAMKEQERAIETADQMNLMMQRLDSISNSAANTNDMADTASTSTKLAHESVSDTLNGMSDIRATVQETGKRIKQLGERSQEISHVIEIIETIAERTTLLALNASMQAVAAGDEGKGFSVIAEEIQRLAESSRESTGQISTLVRNIQQETNTTIETMDKTIEQVVDGSMKAEGAAEQMKKVLDTTSELVTAVDQIAIASKDQVEISKDLKHKAEGILKSTQVTGQELLSLTGLSRNMSDYAQQLVSSVDVFNLGDDGSDNENQDVVATQV